MLELINENYNASVNMTEFKFDLIYPLELTPERFTALTKLSAADAIQTNSIHHILLKQAKPPEKPTDTLPEREDITSNHWQGIEAFVVEGECHIDGNTYGQGSYLRIPALKDKRVAAVTECILFIKLNQFLPGDRGIRTIDTLPHDSWLPGPANGIEIRPLHVFDTESIMLLRWRHAAEFKPKLNPRGEEILVINGLLQNRDNLYRQYSWIRNPIEDWRKWHGNTGTLAYYKSGHFPSDPARDKST